MSIVQIFLLFKDAIEDIRGGSVSEREKWRSIIWGRGTQSPKADPGSSLSEANQTGRGRESKENHRQIP